ncbi:TH1 protein [Polychytrium aggregatum]|nr:TH1 protein [Polychytrium aggregatum]KAI9202786.1 TH1 protein [Polychytrium aggregatum]
MLLPMCSASEFNYIIAQALLHRAIALGTEGHTTLSRVSEMLEEHVHMIYSNRSKVVRETANCIGPLSREVGLFISNVETSGRLSQGDMQKFSELYVSSSASPSLDLVRRAEFMDALVIHLFGEMRISDVPNASEKAFILAFISSAILLPDGSLDTSRVEPMKERILELGGLLERVTSTIEVKNAFPELLQALEHPLTSMALLHWISKMLEDTGFIESDIMMGDTPLIFYLLDEATILRPFQRPRIFDIWTQNLRKSFDGKDPLITSRFKDAFVDRVLFMAGAGYQSPIIEYFEKQSEEIDETVMTYFIKKLLERTEPPYPREMALSLLAMINGLDSRSPLRRPESIDHYSRFMAACADPLNDLPPQAQALAAEMNAL